MPELDRRLREVAQLRKLWRAFREPQERLEDERISKVLIRVYLEAAKAHLAEPAT